ncbi:MAG: BlaI/MecI/CopY family transcriptional regulator, partial [Paramuribaculum sp.]|nr:BlaI/MecI/CopY family transcriptional regulator [Paramuribaculum sp.]
LTPKEEIIMNHFWANGPMTIKALQSHCAGSFIPHINTLSTIVRGLEEEGWMIHEQTGKT